MDYVGQKTQDKWIIEDVFHFRRNGTFLDLAATDGVSLNNTVLLERQLGWNGIAIEANPQYFENLKNNRQCKCIQACIDEVSRAVRFLPNGDLGGVIDNDTDNNPALRSTVIGQWEAEHKILFMQSKPLANILRECDAPRVIDYFSFDVEGCETRILRHFPFDCYTFLALTIERPTPELNKKLFENGYMFVKNVSYDSFYIHSTLPNKNELTFEPFEQIPPKDW